MENATYVFHLVEQSDSPFKHFRALADARAFADKQVQSGEIERALIYKVGASEPREAVALVKQGEAELVDLRYPKASDEEIQRDFDRRMEIARGQGPKEMLRVLGLLRKKNDS
jgi:hypothetical protein